MKVPSLYFIEFMLEMINEKLDSTLDSVEKERQNLLELVNKLLEVMEPDIPYSANYYFLW